MKKVFDAANSIEAHMISNLLEQAGVAARVEGEYLQGGVGELPAGGLVRVMVADEDAEAARSVIAEWDARQERVDPVPYSGTTRGFGGFALGMVAGAVLVIWIYHTPVTQDGIDYDGDGRLDETRHYQGSRLQRIERDRNLDGASDFIHLYSPRGLIEETRADEDFDGRYETVITYVHGNPALLEADTNGDGTVDRRAHFVAGVLTEIELLGADDRAPRKRQRFDLGRLVSADYDADADGRMDTRYEYDFFEEPVHRIANGNSPDALPGISSR